MMMTRKRKISTLSGSAFLACSLSPAWASGPDESERVSLVGHLDIEGGGMVDVHDGVAYIGHVAPPYATSILDVSDPRHPKILSRIKTAPNTHSHKARVCGDTLITNREQWAPSRDRDIANLNEELQVGLAVFDVSDPTDPREITLFESGGFEPDNVRVGVHRFEFDCETKLAYISATVDGYRGNIVRIVDLADRANPKEVGRWWLTGQWTGGGERPTWERNVHRVHHPNRWGNRLYVSLWEGGFAIVDISDMNHPRTVSYVQYDHPSPTHTALPVGHEIEGKKWLLVFDEDVTARCEDPPAPMWIVDITNEEKPEFVTHFQVREGGKYASCEGRRFGAHQPHEYVGEDNLVYAAWFSAGLRIIDISKPAEPREVGYYIPEPVGDEEFPQSNDVFVDDKGLIYLIDRHNGLDILKYEGDRREGTTKKRGNGN